MSRYDPASGGWAVQWQITGSTGSYTFGSITSTARNAYQNNPCIDHNGRIHMSWIWRESGKLSNGQHDLCYMYSDDGGRTFRNHLGGIVTQGSKHAGINSRISGMSHQSEAWPEKPAGYGG